MRPYVLLTDITACLVFLTRIPLAVAGLDAERKLARSAWAFGIVGVLVGGIGAVVYAIAWGLGLVAMHLGILLVSGGHIFYDNAMVLLLCFCVPWGTEPAPSTSAR